MEANWIIISIVVVFSIILIVILIRRNQDDEKDLENYLNENESPQDEEDEMNDTI